MKLKNRIHSGLLTTCLLLSLVPVTASAFSLGKTDYGMSYEITDAGTVGITDMDESYTGALTIPDTIEGKPVTAIERYAFCDCSGLTSVSIPATVTSIDESAFSGCSSLETFTFPDGVEKIGEFTFYDCTSLTEVTIPDSVTSIGRYAFFDCWNLTEITIPESVTEIDEYAFGCCSLLQTVVIPDGVTSISRFAFYNCVNLNTITIPAGVTEIGESAFDDSVRLKDVYFNGTEEQWNQITIGADNVALDGAEIHFAASEDETPDTPDEPDIPDEPDTPDEPDAPDEPDTPAVTDVFTDVIPGKWYVPYIQTAVDNKFMSGTSDTTFEPNGTATRAMFVQILYAMAGKPDVSGLTCPFADVISGKWYYNAVVWAYNNEVTAGTSDTTFGTNDPITREQVALLLYAYEGRPEVSGKLEGFADTASVHSWAYNGMLWANQNGIINGSSEGDKLYLNPLKNASRAEIATMMSAFYKIEDTETTPDEPITGPTGEPINAEVGGYITFGTYEQDNDLTNGAEPIEWRVLAVEDGKALVISKYALDCKPYNETHIDVTWETCTLRSWLNSDFCDAAFSDYELSRIQVTTVQNPDACRGYDDDYDWIQNNTGEGITQMKYRVDGGNETNDRIFLLSLDEAKTYFDYSENEFHASDDVSYNGHPDLLCAPTAYALAQGASHTRYTLDNGEFCVDWWLRTPGCYAYDASYVDVMGEAGTCNSVNENTTVVRPVMWITLD